MFRFKQFTVDQTGCAMKINTDGVLLGSMAEADNPEFILDIGTGTGVIALMLAQRFTGAMIDAVEIDADAARTAGRNFSDSPFADRLQVFSTGFEQYFEKNPDKKYDLIVSNPPFYIDSLKSPGIKTNLAKHTDIDFFKRLIGNVTAHLSPAGVCWLVLPVNLEEIIGEYAEENCLYQPQRILIRSYAGLAPHRMIISLSAIYTSFVEGEITIYESKGVYSEVYRNLLQPYFLAF